MDGESLADVIRGAQRGDSASYDRLAGLYASRVFGFLYRMTGSRVDAEDLTQEVFVRLVRMLPSYRHEGRFEPWLFRIAANLGRDRVRRARRSPRQVAADGEDRDDAEWLNEIPAEADGPDLRLVRDEEIDALGRALNELPESERTVIMLRHFSQMSFKEVAEATGTPLGTALARAHRGLKRLREIMTGEATEARYGGCSPEEPARK